MDIAEALEFIRSNHHGVLATTRKDGRHGDVADRVRCRPDGKVVVSTRETAMKVKHIARDPHVAICVLNDGFFGAWAQSRGLGRDRAPSRGDGRTRRLLPARVPASTPTGDDYRAAMERERRVLLRITVTA
jgi:PPOX class probable F420-dependent enzyme